MELRSINSVIEIWTWQKVAQYIRVSGSNLELLLQRITDEHKIGGQRFHPAFVMWQEEIFFESDHG